MSQQPRLDRGVFVLSLDFELIWGTLDLFGPEGFRRACERERDVVQPLLDLLDEFEVPATWCVVGHLFLERCEAANGRVHPDLVRPSHDWCRSDWFAHDPAGDERSHPTFYGRSLVRRILACRTPQEIGSHSFSHVIFGDPGCSRAAAESELLASLRAARELGLELRSFAFPRNSVGHTDVLRAHGIRCYRGAGPRFYEKDDAPGPLGRAAHLLDVLLARRPLPVRPERDAQGLWNIPGSMIYFPMHGIRRHIPVGLRVARACKGLDAAARDARVFHLWFHPTNLADETEAMLSGLRRILDHALALRTAGKLTFASMGRLAEWLEQAAPLLPWQDRNAMPEQPLAAEG